MIDPAGKVCLTATINWRCRMQGTAAALKTDAAQRPVAAALRRVLSSNAAMAGMQDSTLAGALTRTPCLHRCTTMTHDDCTSEASEVGTDDHLHMSAHTESATALLDLLHERRDRVSTLCAVCVRDNSGTIAQSANALFLLH
jgi:hypothetical protein